MALHWYVIRTEPGEEYLAADELRRDGFEVLFPRAKTPHPRTGHGDVPLFPGYLFLGCDANREGMPSLARVAHVLGWVSFGGVVPRLPDEFVEELGWRLEAINREGGLSRWFRRGEKVCVVSGSLQNLAEVVVVAKSPQARVRLLMEFMGRLVSAQVPWDSRGPAEEGPKNKRRVPRRTRGGGRWIKGFGPRAGEV